MTRQRHTCALVFLWPYELPTYGATLPPDRATAEGRQMARVRLVGISFLPKQVLLPR